MADTITDHDLDTTVRHIAERLRVASTAVVCGHVNPDGDALGSLLAIAVALRSIGVDAQPAWGGRDAETPPAPMDPNLSFLALADQVREPGDTHAAPDVLVCCDTAARHRLGTLAPLCDAAETVVVVDHHATGDGFGDLRLVDVNASSTGVLALQLIDALDVPLDPAIAEALYLAILTDTGRFSYAATSPRDHRVAARLIEAGADHARIARAVYGTASAGYLDLVARFTARAEVTDELVSAWTTQADLEKSGATPEETDGLVELLRKVAHADVSLLLRETTTGRWRCSLRSRGATNVAEIAAVHGGGGHRLAAGFTADGDPQDVIVRVRTQLREGLQGQ